LEYIHPDANLSRDVKVSPGCVIGCDVKIGSGTTIGTGVIINSGVEIGKNNEIHPYAVIGDTPQDKSYSGEGGKAIIGNNNIIREFTTIHIAVFKFDRNSIRYAFLMSSILSFENPFLLNPIKLGEITRRGESAASA